MCHQSPKHYIEIWHERPFSLHWFSFMLLLISLYFSEKRTEDEPKILATAASVDLVLLETPRQEVAKPVAESTAVVQGILGCHSSLVVRISCTRVLLLSCRVLCLDCVLLTKSG